jgi:integrase
VFVLEGLVLHPDSLSHAFRRISSKAGFDLRLHDLRHLHASGLLTLGVHPKVVQGRLGHSSINITMDLYSHVMPGLQAEAADLFEGHVSG